MKVCLPEKIREFRKGLGLTQEQLAEAMGVTVGAVSKWESGASTPDVGLIMELAEFFETSVDVLLGFSQQSENLESALKGLKDLRLKKDYPAALRKAEKLLQKYPNQFQAVYECACTFQLAGMELRDDGLVRRSLELFQRSLELEAQNSDPEISAAAIRNAIAEGWLILDNTQKALELFKENNAMGMNEATIGIILAKEEATSQEALTHLSRALLGCNSHLHQAVVGHANACLHLGWPQEALELIHLFYALNQGMMRPGKRSYPDKAQVMLLCLEALCRMKLGDEPEAKRCLREAKTQAEYFDAAPDYSAKNIKFIHLERDAAAYDDFGSSAMDGILKMIEEDGREYPRLKEMWEEICHEEA